VFMIKVAKFYAIFEKAVKNKYLKRQNYVQSKLVSVKGSVLP
jgi:hypothetical protein